MYASRNIKMCSKDCLCGCLSRKLAEPLEKSSILSKLLRALEMSSRIMAEDYAREGGYMLPQSPLVKDLPGE